MYTKCPFLFSSTHPRKGILWIPQNIPLEFFSLQFILSSDISISNSMMLTVLAGCISSYEGRFCGSRNFVLRNISVVFRISFLAKIVPNTYAFMIVWFSKLTLYIGLYYENKFQIGPAALLYGSCALKEDSRRASKDPHLDPHTKAVDLIFRK